MPSTVIRDIRYDERKLTLWITFVSGRVYAYDRVPKAIYVALCNASSKGAFFNLAIRDRFPFRELPQDRNRSAR